MGSGVGAGMAPASEGRLLARPGAVSGAAVTGEQRLGTGGRREAILYVPPGYTPESPAPFALSLHGAGGRAENGLWPLRELADSAGIILLAPSSRRQTWDLLTGGFGPDVAVLDDALRQTFDRYAVDPHRLAIGGFSDGASYALTLGLMNGDMFTHILAYSPGFMAPMDQRGSPRVYISHGTNDSVLAIDRCSRRIVPQLQRAGYDVTYREFMGPHTVPPEIARESLSWLLGAPVKQS